MRLIVGLGNPGRPYAGTRHNAGAACVEFLAARHQIPLNRRTPWAVLGQGTIEGQPVVLARLRTYMNTSGEAVSYLLRRFHGTPQELLVIFDDLDLPLGKMRLRTKGSAGGHRGVQSIIDALGTEEFPRLRVGIGRPPEGVDEVTYVLGGFTPEEQETVQEVYSRAAEAMGLLLTEGVEAAMNRFNTR